MTIIRDFSLRVLLGFASLVVTHALLVAVHAVGWYPENQLASLFLSTSEAWEVEWIKWGLTALGTLSLWAVADYWLYRRERAAPAGVSLSPMTSSGEPEADIDARAAFFRTLEQSQWRAHQDATTDPKNLVYDWREVRLSAEIHKALRNSRLLAWGEECLPGTAQTPEKPIPPETWDRVVISFDLQSLPRTAAHFRGRTSRELGQMAWVGVRFSSVQILQLFPLREAPTLDRVSMIDLAKMAVNQGWNFSDQGSLQLIDLQDALRQGGLDGIVTVWGRLNRWPNSEQLMRKEVLEKVPPEHWREFRAHLFGVLTDDNFQTFSWHVQPSSTAEKGYVDLYAERAQAADWLRRDAVSFRGQTTSRNKGSA